LSDDRRLADADLLLHGQGGVLLALARTEGDWSEVFVERGTKVDVEFSKGARGISSGSTDGVAVRLRRSDAVTFAHTNSISTAAIHRLLADITPIDRGTAGSDDDSQLSDIDLDRHRRLATRQEAERLLDSAEEAAAEQGATDLRVRFSRQWRSVSVAGSDGRRGTDRSCHTYVSVDLRRDGARASAKLAVGGDAATDEFAGRRLVEAAAAEAARTGSAAPPTSGRYSVLFAPAAAGILMHEAIGHPLEADTALAGSALWRLRGTRFSHPDLQVAEEPANPQAWVPAVVDEEGSRCRRVALIEAGVVLAVVSDRATAEKIGQETTGHARRGSFASPPMPRVRHTVVTGGRDDDADLLSGSDDGILVERILAADADPGRGGFTARVERGRRIRSGRLADTLADFTVRGDLGDFRSLDGIGTRSELGQALCGRAGHWLPISYSSPALHFGRLAVYGRDDGR
jgi:TldD protein